RLNERLYDLLSRAAHNRRSACVVGVWEEGREMTYGRQPSPLRRGYYVEWAASFTVDVLQVVGDTLAIFFGEDFLRTEIEPLVNGIAAVRRELPLDEDSIRAAVGAADSGSG
ncbi:MAG TPA: hypothetical protein VFM94_05860, partial [Solirubrobacterales bacterium]|nr:hypothetical protein [Solirubrobacterales bacterium]